MSFSLELDHVDQSWVEAAYGPDAVYFEMRGDGQEVTGYTYLSHFLRLYELLRLERENTRNRFAVVAVEVGIHIVSVPPVAQKTAFSTTYDDAHTEVRRFLSKIFHRLAESDDDDWENQGPQFDSFLDELSFRGIYRDVMTA